MLGRTNDFMWQAHHAKCGPDVYRALEFCSLAEPTHPTLCPWTMTLAWISWRNGSEGHSAVCRLLHCSEYPLLHRPTEGCTTLLVCGSCPLAPWDAVPWLLIDVHDDLQCGLSNICYYYKWCLIKEWRTPPSLPFSLPCPACCMLLHCIASTWCHPCRCTCCRGLPLTLTVNMRLSVSYWTVSVGNSTEGKLSGDSPIQGGGYFFHCLHCTGSNGWPLQFLPTCLCGSVVLPLVPTPCKCCTCCVNKKFPIPVMLCTCTIFAS